MSANGVGTVHQKNTTISDTNVNGDVIIDGTKTEINNTLGDVNVDQKPPETQNMPQKWERIIAMTAAVLWIGLIGFLAIRNEPLSPNIVVLVRIVLSVMAAILGAMIPGFLELDIKTGPNLAIRAGGALALFVISYLLTPNVIM